MITPNVFNIPAGANFAETLAEGVLARFGASPLALAKITIFLPTRRAARNFGDAFARKLGGSALLPQFRALGDVSAEDIAFTLTPDSLEIAPAISPFRQRLLLATLVRQWHRAKRGRLLPFADSLAYADALSALLHEFETHSVDLSRLEGLVSGPLAQHWIDVCDFLFLLREEWPPILDAEKRISAARYRNLAISALSQKLSREADRPVIAAGSTGSIPATRALLATIAQLPAGAVILPGLDLKLDGPGWDGVGADPAHPQFGLKQLLDRLGLAREDIRDWAEARPRDNAREHLLAEALRPAPTTDAWRTLADKGATAIEAGLKGLSLVEASNLAEEAAAIALMLRHALETPKASAALVTPDRALARRVASELARFSIEIDDSAGLPLAATSPGGFLALMAEAAGQRFAPVPLLALLKHPLAAMGRDHARFTGGVRELDRTLRGPRPDAGLGGIARAISDRDGLSAWFEHLASALRPLETLMANERASIAELMDALIEAAERLSETENGAVKVWAADAGVAASEFCAALREAAADIPDIECNAFASLFRRLAEEAAVRPVFGQHPRLQILGPLEARLQTFDLVILGSLNEGTWPRVPAADPWLSRPMRSALGLDAPEREVGLAAHDFASLAAQTRVILTRATKKDGAPTVASRWLQRLQHLAKGLGLSGALKPEIDWLHLARTAYAPAKTLRAQRPAPKPPVAMRPRSLSVTDVERWRRDPYTIYAKHILKLRPLDPLDAHIGALERGNLVHKALEVFVLENPGQLPEDAAERLIAIGDRLFEEQKIPKSLLAIWKARFAHAAVWFVFAETEARDAVSQIFVEARGAMRFPSAGGEFELRGRADRIDLMKDGSARIIDYKTGQLPSLRQVKALLAPQLPLEAAILREGGFAAIPALATGELVYVQFSGGSPAGAWNRLNIEVPAISAEAVVALTERIARFDDPETPYLSRALAYRSDFPGDYDHLARVGEWLAEPPEDWQN